MTKKNKSPRRQGREKAFQVLYGVIFMGTPIRPHVERTFEHFVTRQDHSSHEVNEFAWELVSGVLERMKELDEIIGYFSKNWRLDRIAKIELTILRLSAYEMLFRSDVPAKVAINEAIELSKKYGDNQSSRFVNGILDAVAKWQREGGLSPEESGVPPPPAPDAGILDAGVPE
jgi:N utilization substance protein B